MIPKSGHRFSEMIMLKGTARSAVRDVEPLDPADEVDGAPQVEAEGVRPRHAAIERLQRRGGFEPGDRARRLGAEHAGEPGAQRLRPKSVRRREADLVAP